MDIFQKCRDYKDPEPVKAAGIYPYFQPIEESHGSWVRCRGKKLVMIGSNNYLGLTHDPRVKEAAIEATRRFGTGCTGSRLLNGNLTLHEELEGRLAKFVGKPAALVFSTGFLTNLGAISCLANEGEFIFSDSENHASIIAGCSAAKAKVIKYGHSSMPEVVERLKQNANGAVLVVTDGVFSMTGAIADLPGLVKVKKNNPRVRLYVDDAHSFGVLGNGGRGTSDHFGLTEEVDVIMGTFSKTFASIGGFVASEPDVIDFIRHKARALIFSAAAPAASVAAVLKCLDIMESEPEHVERVRKNTQKMREGFESLGINIVPSNTAIIPVRVGEDLMSFKLVRELFERGLFATPVIYPAVPLGHSMIRTSYMATHTDDDLNFVLEVFSGLAKEYPFLKKG